MCLMDSDTLKLVHPGCYFNNYNILLILKYWNNLYIQSIYQHVGNW